MNLKIDLIINYYFNLNLLWLKMIANKKLLENVENITYNGKKNTFFIIYN